MKWVPNRRTTVSTDFFKKRNCINSSLFIINYHQLMRYNSLWLWRWLPHRLLLSVTVLNSGLHIPGRSNSIYLWNVTLASTSVANYTVEPPLTATSLQRPVFFVLADKKSIHWPLFKTSIQRPPLYNGHFLLYPRWPLWRGLTVNGETFKTM